MHAALAKELRGDPEECEKQCRSDFAKGYGRGPKPAGLGGGDL
jgi:hypothetical protein